MMLAYQPIRSLATINMVAYQGAAASKELANVIDKELKLKNNPNLPEILIIKNCKIEFEKVILNMILSNERAVQ